MTRTRLPSCVMCAAALLVAGCGGSGGDADQGPVRVAAPAGVSVEVLQYRSDVVARRFQLKVRNGGSAKLTVLGVRLASRRFSAPAVWAGQAAGETVDILPGEATDLPVQVPPAACGSAAAGGAADDARLDLPRPGGGTGAATLRVTDPFALLGRLRDDDCRRAGATRIAALSVAEPLRVQGSGRAARAFLLLRIAPTGAPGAFTIRTIDPTTLITPAGGAPQWTLDRTVDAASGPADVPIEFRPARCDPHAIAEDKLGTVIRLDVTFRDPDAAADVTPGRVEITSPAPVRNAVYDFVSRACGNA